MNKIILNSILLLFSISILSCNQNKITEHENEENEKYDGPAQAMQQMYDAMKDPATGKVPMDKFWAAIAYTDQLKNDLKNRTYFNSKTTGSPAWTERGPNSDVAGPYGNSRANNGVTSGRIRAIWVDLADATGNTVWVGGIDGGLWKTTTLTASPAGWSLINDRFNNLAITSICQDPSNTNIMYFCTGEPTYNTDGINGIGVFKSTDHGVTWNQLASTSTFTSNSKILCDALGNVYLGTISTVKQGSNTLISGFGLQRSIDHGTSWVNITPSGLATDITDINFTSSGTLHVVCGYNSAYAAGSYVYGYRRTTSPSTVTSSTWTSATTPYATTSFKRVILTSQGTTLLAIPADYSTKNVISLYESTDDGVTWSAIANVPSGASSGQGWYCLAGAIDPSNASNMIIGGLDLFKTTNSGASAWSQISTWYGTTPVNQYVHADQHAMVWYSASAQSRVLVGCDGGLFLSTNGGSTWVDKNVGLRIKQFYSCDLNPTSGSNIALAGAQDNGCHQFANAGLSSTIEVTGGDGMFVSIDQINPTKEIGAYVYNVYNTSNDGGSNWNYAYFYTGTSSSATNMGKFVNPWDYDDSNKIVYASANTGNYFRWTTPFSTPNGQYFESDATTPFPTGASQVAVTALGSGQITAVSVNPFKNRTVYFGTDAGKLVKVYGANTVASSAGVNLSTGLPAGTIHNIAFGSDSNHIAVTYSNYGINNVWLSTNGGTSWTAIDNNLPDMPVWWALFDPTTDTKMIIGTETGVWGTKALAGASTNWIVDPTFPNVSTQMLKMRSSDNMVAAATHGRGMWTGLFANIITLPFTEFNITAQTKNNEVNVEWKYKSQRIGIKFEIQTSDDGKDFKTTQTISQGNSENYSSTLPTGNYFIRIKATDLYGYVEYSRIAQVNDGNIQKLTVTSIFPNPAIDNINLVVQIPNNHQTVFFKIIDIFGRLVSQYNNNGNFGEFHLNIPLNNLSQGQYIMIVDNGIDKIEKKIIKL